MIAQKTEMYYYPTGLWFLDIHKFVGNFSERQKNELFWELMIVADSHEIGYYQCMSAKVLRFLYQHSDWWITKRIISKISELFEPKGDIEWHEAKYGSLDVVGDERMVYATKRDRVDEECDGAHRSRPSISPYSSKVDSGKEGIQ